MGVVRTDLDMDFSDKIGSEGGWVGMSVALYEGSKACEDGAALVSFSQGVVYVPKEGGQRVEDWSKYFAINVPVGGGFGWGTVGEDLAMRFKERGVGTIFTQEVHGGVLRGRTREGLGNALDISAEGREDVKDMVAIHALGKVRLDEERRLVRRMERSAAKILHRLLT